MAPQLLQVKVTPELKKDLQGIAEYKGIPLTSYIKLTLTKAARKEKKVIYTENGLTITEEKEILRREKEAIKAFKAGKLKVYTSSKAFFKHLNAKSNKS